MIQIIFSVFLMVPGAARLDDNIPLRSHDRILSGLNEHIPEADSCAIVFDVSSVQNDFEGRLVHLLRNFQYDAVNELLNSPGFDINQPDAQGMTDLMHVAKAGDYYGTLILLHDPNIDIHRIDRENQTALDWALKQGRTKVVELLQLQLRR